MSASDQMRAMLDQLMGTARNGEYNPVNRANIPFSFQLGFFLEVTQLIFEAKKGENFCHSLICNVK